MTIPDQSGQNINVHGVDIDIVDLKKRKSVSEDGNLPNYVRPEWVRWLPDLNLIFRLLGGTRVMWEFAWNYIRKWTDEEIDTYVIRSKIEQVFEGLGRTISAAIGMLFAKPPEIEYPEGSPAEGLIDPLWTENIDGAGTSGDVFLKRFSYASIRDGTGLILVDFPAHGIDEEGNIIEINAADEENDLGLRPTWARYDRDNIRNWLVANIDNQEVTTQVSLFEPANVPDGIWGVRVEERWRILTLRKILDNEEEIFGGFSIQAHWTLWRLLPEKEGMEITDYEVVSEGVFTNKDGEIANRLPIGVAYTGQKIGPFVAVPPLLGVAWANLGLWQIASNLRFYLDLVCFPQPTVIGDLADDAGFDEDGNRIGVPGNLKVGPMVAVHLTSGDADSGPSEYKFTVPPSEGFEPNERAMVRKREDMAALGMSFLDRDKRMAETAEAKRLDAAAENATLATAATEIDNASNEAMKWTAWYFGLESEQAPVISLNKDFESTTMSPQMMMAWISGVEKADLPPHVLLEALKRGGLIPKGVDIEELEREMMAIQAAREEAEQAQRDAESAERLIAQSQQTPPDEGEE